jgi:hypothetical protein
VPRGAWIWIVLVVAATSCGGGGTLSNKDFQKQAEAVQSFAAEGALVAQTVQQGRTTETFVRVHTEYLAKAAGEVESELGSKHASGSLEQKREQAAKLASLVSQNLDRLHRNPGDRALAARLRLGLEDSAAAAEELAK